jgi:hypothetical protein
VKEQHRTAAHPDNLHLRVDELTALQEIVQAESDVLLPSVRDNAFKGDLQWPRNTRN